MDDEETVWKLDATCLSGFAIHSLSLSSPSTSTLDPMVEGLKWIHHSIETVDIQISFSPRSVQDLESRSTMSSNASTSGASTIPSTIASGVVLLLPLNHILSITISNHSPHGQTLRFKLTSPPNNYRSTDRIRQSISSSGPGRMYGVNESDPFDILGLLKFRELNVKIAGNRGHMGEEAVVGWTECLRRNAEREWGWGVQILREGEDGVWDFLERDERGGSGEGKALMKREERKMEVEGEGDDEVDEEGRELRIPSVEVSEGTLVSDTPASDLDRESVSRRSSHENLKRGTISPKPSPREYNRSSASPSRTRAHPEAKQHEDVPRTPQERSPSPPASDAMSVEDGERRRESDDFLPERSTQKITGSTRCSEEREYSRSPPPFRPKLTGANKIDLSYNRYLCKRDRPPPYEYRRERSPVRRYNNANTRFTPPFRRHYNNKPYDFPPRSDRYNHYHTPRRFSTSDAMTRSSEPYRSYSDTFHNRRFDTYKPYTPHRRPGYQPRFQREENTNRNDGKRHASRNNYDDQKKFGSDGGERPRSRSMDQEEVIVFPPRKENYLKRRVPQIERRE